MTRSLLRLIAATLFSAAALADTVKVDNPWVRATAPGQKVAGGFMTLTADDVEYHSTAAVSDTTTQNGVAA